MTWLDPYTKKVKIMYSIDSKVQKPVIVNIYIETAVQEERYKKDMGNWGRTVTRARDELTKAGITNAHKAEISGVGEV